MRDVSNQGSPLDSSAESAELFPRREGTLESVSSLAVSQAHFGNGFVRPLYESFCFSNLPGFIERALLGQSLKPSLPNSSALDFGKVDHVIFAFFDAFGWQSFERFRAESAFLSRFEREGVIAKTTSQFPSTTAVHVTTMASGLPAFEHEICGWDYFEPRVGRMIKPLRFSYSEDASSHTLLKDGFRPDQVLPEGKFYPNLLAEKIEVRTYGPKAFFPSAFGERFISSGALRGIESLEAGVQNVTANLAATNGKSYDYLYFDAYDSACHRYGPLTDRSDGVARRVLLTLESLCSSKLPSNTLLIVTADHGQVADREGGALAVNHLIPNLAEYLKKDSRGEPIRFTGGKRYLFLHPAEQAQGALIGELQLALRGAADVLTIPQLEKLGLLGPQPAKHSYIERLGTVAILPYAGYSVNWLEEPFFNNRDISGHGGASYQEMETPLLMLKV